MFRPPYLKTSSLFCIFKIQIMEKIKLTNGKVMMFPTIEDNEYKFYYCSDKDEATTLQMTLTDIGNKCTVDKINGDFYVILFKQL